MSDRHQWRCNDRRGASANVDVDIDVSVKVLTDAYGWNRPGPVPGRPCHPGQRPNQPTWYPDRPAVPAPPAYAPAGNFERSSGTTTWNNSYDHTATGGGRGYDTGSKSWDKGNYSNPYGSGNWDKGSVTWNKGSDNGYYGGRNWSAGSAGYSNGSDNNVYTGSHQYSTGGVDFRAGNDFGTTGGNLGWNARNDNGYKTGSLTWGNPLGGTRLSWNGTDSAYQYRYETYGIAGNMAGTFGTLPAPNYYNFKR